MTDPEATEQTAQRTDGGSARLERAALLSVLVAVALAALKVGFAILSRSVGLLAESVHSSADALASGAVLAGLKISRRKSASFPYGLYKVENLVALGLAVLIFAAAYEIGRQAVLAEAREVTHIPGSLSALAVAILTTIVLARYKARVGKASNSPSLMADAQHSWVDVLSTGAVAVGLAGTWVGLPLDRVAALVVLIFILRLGWQTLVDAVRVLLDASVDRTTLDKVRAIISDEHAVQDIVQLVGRSSGRYRFIEADLVLRVRDLEKAARVAARIEHRVREQVGNVDHVALHCEPLRKETWRYVIPLEDREGAVSEHFGEAPFFALADVRASDRHVLRWTIVDNPHLQLDKGKGIRVSEFLVGQGMDYLVLRERTHGRGPEYVLRDAGVEVEMTDGQRLDLVLRELGVRGLGAATERVTE
jgi:cation diffusion facilitator family transporter